MSGYTVYNLEVQAMGVAADVRLNDARVFVERKGGRRFTQKKLNPWLFDGHNEIAARLDWPEGVTPTGDAPAGGFRMAVIRMREGQDWPEDDDWLLRFEWKPGEPAMGSEGLTEVIRAPLALGPVHGRWSWQDATPYEPSQRGEVVALVSALHAALAARDGDGFVGLLGVRNAEVARALGGEAHELEGDLRAQLATLFAADDFRVARLDAEGLLVEPSAGGRLVDVSAPDGAPAIVTTGGDAELELGLTLSRLAQGFAVVR